MQSEFSHVSEVYQTTITIFVMVLAVIEVACLFLDVSEKILQCQMEGYTDEKSWAGKNNQIKEDTQSDKLEKSVSVCVQNEIIDMQKNDRATDGEEGHEQQQQPKQEVQIKPAELMENNENSAPVTENKQKFIRLYTTYNAFISQHMSILMPILIVGILTQSTYVYSLACFFCTIFCFISFDFLKLEEQVKQQYKKGFVIRRLVKILSTLIIMSIFLSYWIVEEYDII